MELEPGPDERRALLSEAVRFVEAALAGLAAAPALGPERTREREILAGLDASVREAPRPLGDALAWLDAAKDLGLQTAGPGYLAYVPGGGLVSAAVAGFLALALNRFTALAGASPGLARLEASVVEFLAREVGLPPTAAGVLPTGGSLANFGAIVTAREARLAEGDLRSATIYASRETHRSVMKAARLAGFPRTNVREIEVDQRLRMRIDALVASIERDRATGYVPFIVVANGGTTNTGAIDPLREIADLAERERLWLHVDAAYGGAFVLTPEGRAKLMGIERADSVTLDPHKGLFLPYGTGCLLVRDGELLRRAHAEGASYLQDLDDLDIADVAGDPSGQAEAAVEGAGGPGRRARARVLSAADLGPELSRNERGLLLWLPFWVHGVGAFRAALGEKLALARELHAALAAFDLELPLTPELSIVTLRTRRREGEALATWNARNLSFLDAINARRRVCLSSTLLPGADGAVVTLRACVLSFRTHADRIAMAVEDIRAALDDVDRL